jgi:hypothetical protein
MTGRVGRDIWRAGLIFVLAHVVGAGAVILVVALN